MPDTRIIFSDIEKRFGDNQILTHSDLEIKSGQCILLCGKNGSGKTTLLRIIAGLDEPDSGYVNTGLGGSPWKQCRQELRQTSVYLHQEPYMFDGDVVRNLRISLHGAYTRKQREHQIRSALKWAGLEHIAHNYAKTLSGGERQRVAIARAWLRKPEILLLDEPVTNMDRDSRTRTVQLLLKLKHQGMALVVTSHDPVHFGSLTDTFMEISDGRIHGFRFNDNITPIHFGKNLSEHAN